MWALGPLVLQISAILKVDVGPGPFSYTNKCGIESLGPLVVQINAVLEVDVGPGPLSCTNKCGIESLGPLVVQINAVKFMWGLGGIESLGPLVVQNNAILKVDVGPAPLSCTNKCGIESLGPKGTIKGQ